MQDGPAHGWDCKYDFGSTPGDYDIRRRRRRQLQTSDFFLNAFRSGSPCCAILQMEVWLEDTDRCVHMCERITRLCRATCRGHHRPHTHCRPHHHRHRRHPHQHRSRHIHHVVNTERPARRTPPLPPSPPTPCSNPCHDHHFHAGTTIASTIIATTIIVTPIEPHCLCWLCCMQHPLMYIWQPVTTLCSCPHHQCTTADLAVASGPCR